MSRTDRDDTGLDAFFEAAGRYGAAPDAAFRARLLDDALAAQPAPTPTPDPTGRRQRPGWFAALGGWPVLSGLATATVAGVWIGIAQPAAVGDLAFGGFGGDYDFSALIGGSYSLGLADG